ncbi:hypothetical protein JTB14_020979 [Gonioctena quinquepunctata]|nr:hypothetical protein JTB14_020979 [Gonioctena quinquepunctata]
MSQTDDDLADLSVDSDEIIKAKVLGEGEVEEDKPIFYDPKDFISGPRITKNGTVPLDILEFDFSFGYNCRKNFNLVVLDNNTVVFASGNFINFFDIETRKIWFRRTALGGGIGHIRKNPNPEYPHFAVAECGHEPAIIIYEWPSLTIKCVLIGSAEHLYSNIDFSPDGELLVSQSGEPDYLITVWNWHERKILLRNKSYVNDVFRVRFSPYIPGQITSCGVGHIKFWKMASTFTGLKLKGEVGRFGKTEYSDIKGILPMPDSKVVSGCDWGNILVWDGGLITLEIFRTLRRRCHDAPIVQFFYEDGELWTVSLDGHVRIWWYEKIDRADPPDDDRVILMDPSYDFYTPGLQLYCVEKRSDNSDDDSWYIAQDGNGGIWRLDLNIDREPEPPVQLYKCHAGKVVDIAACPTGPYLASLGKDGRFYLYNYMTKELVFHQEFPALGRCMIWPGIKVCKTGDVIVAGFDDGQIRVCFIKLNEGEKAISLTISQVIKPHDKSITKMSINLSGDRLVSSGEDCTIFFFKLETSQYAGNMLIPIGFVSVPDIVTCITWRPKCAKKEIDSCYEKAKESEILVGCLHGQMMQVKLPFRPQKYSDSSFELELDPKYKNFKTYKSQIRRNISVRKIEAKKATKRAEKLKEMQRVQKENPGMEIDEEVFLADSDSEEELEPLYIPDVANKILWLKYTDEDTIWLSMAGFDAGYIYEYRIDQKEDVPLSYRMVYDGDDIEISSYIYDPNEQYLIFAMQDGSIRVNSVKKDDFKNLTDYWILAMHDNQHGFVPTMCFSFDSKFFFSCGYDGNIFSYKFQPPDDYEFPQIMYPQNREIIPPTVPDSDGRTQSSLEQTMDRAKNDRIQKLANEHKAAIRETIKSLKDHYSKILDRNKKLLPSQMITREELEPDERAKEYMEKEFESQLALVKKKFAYDLSRSEVQMMKLRSYVIDPSDKLPIVVKGINNSKIELKTVRQRVISRLFPIMMNLVQDKLVEEEAKGRPPQRIQPTMKGPPAKPAKTPVMEYFLLSLSPSVIECKLGPKLTRLLIKYRERREKWDKRLEQVSWSIAFIH